MKNMFWSSERPFGIDHPVMTKERSQEGVKCIFIGEVSDASREGKFSVTKGALQAGDELAAKHSAHRFCNFRESLMLSGLETSIVSSGLATAVKCFRERCR